MAAIKRIGFGQVEPNHLSAQRTYQIYAQLPTHVKAGASDLVPTITQLENGQFAKYDIAKGEVNFSGEGEWMLVYNEVKLYDGYRETYKDYAFIPANFTDNATPRLLKTNIGDLFTTNTLKTAGAKGVETTMEEYAVSDHLVVNSNGFLQKDTQTTPGTWDTTTGMIWEVVKVYNLPDMQAAVKVMRIQ